jgi:S-(hydroxymethyl)glutathione dehydrogenase/alcohol dehydrogenase
MKTKAAVLTEQPGKWQVIEADVDDPHEGEVLVRLVASGLCHSDDHVAKGDGKVAHLPYCGGHEGAGVVEAVGPGVRSLAVGDHIVTSFIPSCGRCRWCAGGQHNLCVNGALMGVGTMLDGSFRLHHEGVDIAKSSLVGAFAELSVMSEWSCIKIPQHLPLRSAALLGCAVPTGWGSAVNAAEVQPGDVVVVMGVGGIGINAVQGARHAGASRIIAVDPVSLKHESALALGATDAFASMAEAADLARSLTDGQGADAAIVTVGVLAGSHVAEAFDAVRKAGTVVVTAVAPMAEAGLPVSPFVLAMFQKRIQGCLYGMMSPPKDVPRLLELYEQGRLKLDELVTRTYTLDEINVGYDDLHAGTNIRGLIDFGIEARAGGA